MKKSFLLACAVTLAATGVSAAECSQETLALGRQLQDDFKSASRELRKVRSRAQGQELRIDQLPAEAGATLPDVPEPPTLPSDLFDADGKLALVCDDSGAAEQQTTDVETVITEILTQIETFSAALDARETDLVAAEDGTLQTDVADTPQTSEPEPDTSSPPAADAEPESDSAEAPPEDDTLDPDTAEVEPETAPDADEVEPEAAPETDTAAAQRKPLPDADNPNIFRRVITLPGGMKYANAGEAGDNGTPLPTFSVQYVFDESTTNGEEWVEVGSSLRLGSQGWIRREAAIDWSTMLVMQFAPKSKRSDVLFFENVTTLADMVNSPFYKQDAADYYKRLGVERDKLAEDGTYQPQWDRALVAVEPETSVTYEADPYILPILDWREESFDGAYDTVLLKVAAVPASAETITDRDNDSMSVSAAEAAQLDDEFRVGMVFVLDNSISMGPFIDRTYQTVEGFYNAFERYESTGYVSFGLVGFRDNIDSNAQIEYVSKVFQPLDTAADRRQVLTNMKQMTAAGVPTLDDKEDGFAGIVTAIEEMDWSPFDARFIIFVTDASSRSGDDNLAANRSLNAETLREIALQSNIAVAPIHLLTPTNTTSGDAQIAESQYRILSETGDLAIEKYIAVDATSDTEFSGKLESMANKIAQAVLKINAGEVLDANLETVPEASPDTDNQDDLADAVVAEIFRAQLESLASVDGGDAPKFLAGWASDRDILDPQLSTLDVSVFLTRNQLSTLDKQLDVIVRAFRSGDEDPQTIFDKLQLLAAEMSTDPDAVRAEDRLAIETLMPAFLKNLPYRSEILRLDREHWASLSVSDRQQFVENLEAKQALYEETFNKTNLWSDFGADDPGQEATPIRLINLP